MVVPAAPALAEIKNNYLYYNALVKSDFAIPDSGFMIIILKLFKGIQLNKLSGVEFLRNFIKFYNNFDKLFLVDPSKENSIINNKYLNNNGINVSIDDHYIAPFYNENDVNDHKLLDLLEKKRPNFIIINLGGGIQEPLGLFLKERIISKNPVSKATASVTQSAAIHPIRQAATKDEPLVINLDSSVSIPSSLENSSIPQ